MVKIIAGCLAMVVCAGCGGKSEAPAGQKTGRKQIYTTTYPLAYAAQQLAGDKADVVFPAPKDEDPMFWEPDAEMVRRYQQADLILVNGAGGEKWTQSATLPAARVVDTAAGFKNEWLMFAEEMTHSHGPEGAHSHGNADFNTWLDPVLFAKQAVAVESALRRLMPVAEAEIVKRGEALRGELKKLYDELDDVKLPAVVASHPVYNYLARRCGWNLQSVHWEPGEMPAGAEWKKLDELLAKHPAKVMMWEGEPLPAIRAEVEKRGMRVVVFAPCGNAPDGGDYMSVMRENVVRLKAAVR